MPTNNNKSLIDALKNKPIGYKAPKYKTFKRTKAEEDRIAEDSAIAKMQEKEEVRLREEKQKRVNDNIDAEMDAERVQSQRDANTAVNLIKIVDPTGISSWPDIIDSYNKDNYMDMLGNAALAVPLIGPRAKIAGMSIKAARRVSTLQKIANVAQPLADMADFQVEPDISQMTLTQFAMGGKTKRSLSQFAVGGKVPVEIEGQEYVETPNGQGGMAKGPSHEAGGIPAALPEGTEVYSKRLSIDGKTMAQRKEQRVKEEEKLNKGVKRNKYDNLSKRALARVQSMNEVLDQKDMQMQEAAKQVYDAPQQQPQMATGGTVGNYSGAMNGAMALGNLLAQAMQGGNNIDPNNPIVSEDGVQGLDPYAGAVMGRGGKVTLTPNTFQYDNPNFQYQPEATEYDPYAAINQTNPYIGNNGAAGVLSDQLSSYMKNKPAAQAGATTTPSMGLTVGDAIGMAGSAIGTVAPLINTLNNRKGDRPNLNQYMNYGREGLETISDNQEILAGMNANAVSATRSRVNASKMGNRNSARDVNTVRALDAVTDMGANNTFAQLADSYANQSMQIANQTAGMQNQRDAYVMQGAGVADQRNRADRDAFFNNLGQNLNNVSTGIQKQGSYLNQAKSREDFLALLPELSKYGLGIDYDANGTPKLVKAK